MVRFLARHWFLIGLAAGVGVGLARPDWVRPVVGPLNPRAVVVAALYLTAWTMPGRSLTAELARPGAALWAVGLSYGLVPACGWLLGLLAPVPDLRVGLLLVSCVPCTLTSAVLWTRLAGGNEATALLTVLGTTFTSWLFTPAWLAWATGAGVEVPAGALMLDLVVCLVIPVVLGQLTRLVPPCARFAVRHRELIGVVSQVLVLAIALKAGVEVGGRLHGGAAVGPALVAWGAALAVGLHVIALAGGLVSSRWLGLDRPRQVAVALACSQKTLPVSLYLFERHFEGFPLAVVPVLSYHVGQLLLDTALAPALRGPREPG